MSGGILVGCWCLTIQYLCFVRWTRFDKFIEMSLDIATYVYVRVCACINEIAKDSEKHCLYVNNSP